jgi:excinuclease UvrABC nuclease subunit
MFAPNEIDVFSLPFVTLDSKKNLPKDSGVYFLIDESNGIRYIGLAINIKNRWAGHTKLEFFKETPDLAALIMAASSE